MMSDKELEKIDKKIAKWHESKSTLEIYEYLGWTKAQYKHFVEYGEI